MVGSSSRIRSELQTFMVTIVVTWRDRKELGLALPTMLECAESLAGEVIIVNFGGNCAALRSYLPSSGRNLSVVDVAKQQFFNKPAAANLGAASAAFPT